MNQDICENLLSTWLSLSATIRNERLVQGMTFREILICNIIYNESLSEHMVTATDIVNRTGILKSQVNKIVVSMENQSLLVRKCSTGDKRRLHLLLTEQGIAQYQAEHADILCLLGKLTDSLGLEKTTALVEQLDEVTSIMKKIITSKGDNFYA